SKCGGFAEDRVQEGAIRKRGNIRDFKEAIADSVGTAAGAGAGSFHCPSGIQNALAQRLRSRGTLFEESQQLPIERARVAEVKAHPLGSAARQTIANSETLPRGLSLQLIRQRVVVAALGVVEKAANSGEKGDRAGRKIFLGGGDSAIHFLRNLPQPGSGLIVAKPAR